MRVRGIPLGLRLAEGNEVGPLVVVRASVVGHKVTARRVPRLVRFGGAHGAHGGVAGASGGATLLPLHHTLADSLEVAVVVVVVVVVPAVVALRPAGTSRDVGVGG